MNAWLNRLEVSFEHLMHVSFQGTIIAMVVLVIGWVVGNRISARWRFALGLVVLGRFALIFAPAASWSLFNVLVPLGPDAPVVQVATATVPVDVMVGSPRPALSPFVTPAPFVTQSPFVTEPPQRDTTPQLFEEPVLSLPTPLHADTSVAPVSRAPSGRPLGILGTLSVIWLAGVGWLLIRNARLHVRLLRQRIHWRVPQDVQVMEMLDQCRRQCNVTAAVRLRLTSDVGPATLGILRPTIVIPAVMVDELSRDELRYVLLHELTHIRRRDWLTELVTTLLVAVHWMNPMIWMVAYRLRIDREFACDAAVLDLLEEPQRKPYGRVVLKVMELASQRRPTTTVVGMATGLTFLHRRIEMISSYRKTSRVSVCSAATLLLLLVAFGWTNARAQSDTETGDTETGNVATADETQTDRSQVNAASVAPVDEILESEPDIDYNEIVAYSSITSGAGILRLNSVEAASSTLQGICLDTDGNPLPGVLVRLYDEGRGSSPAVLEGEQVTTGDGAFRFPDLQESTRLYTVVATLPGFATSHFRCFRLEESLQHDIVFEMSAPESIQGRVTDLNGNPVVGADVWCGLWSLPMPGLTNAKTDHDGFFEINDLRGWDYDASDFRYVGDNAPRVLPNGVTARSGRPRIHVMHPDFVQVVLTYSRVPGTIDFVLQNNGGAIEGRVIDEVTGEPAEGIVVSMDTVIGTESWWGGSLSPQTKTDAQGRFRLTSLRAYTYNIWVTSPDGRTSAAIDSVKIRAGRTKIVGDIDLIKGSWLEGQVIDADTGIPMTHDSHGERLKIRLQGPARPQSGLAAESTEVDDEGRFSFRAPPGRNYPSLTNWDVSQTNKDRTEEGYLVAPREITKVTFLLTTKTDPATDPTADSAADAVPDPAGTTDQ